MMMPIVSPISLPMASIYIMVSEPQILEKHAVKIIVIILPGVYQQAIEILTAFVSYRRVTNSHKQQHQTFTRL